MPRKFLRRLIPDNDAIRGNAAFRGLGGLRNPQVWHLNRRSVSGAVAVGLFVGWLPIPMQMLVAAFFAIVLHVNLPVAALLVWISNPLTLPALLYTAYKTGAYLLGLDVQTNGFEPSIQWFVHRLQDSWQPLMVGCVFLGALSAIIGFFITRLLWRLALLRRWQERKRKLALQKSTTTKS